MGKMERVSFRLRPDLAGSCWLGLDSDKPFCYSIGRPHGQQELRKMVERARKADMRETEYRLSLSLIPM